MWKKWLTVLLISVLALSAAGQDVQAASFKDMKKYKTSLYLEVNYLADAGIISGYPDSRFKPNEPIAKKHIAAMFVKALDLTTDNVKDPGYLDVPKDHPYYKEIAAAYTAGLFSKADRFKPESSISRAFMARLMSKAFHLKVLDNEKYQPSYTDVGKKSEFYTDIMRVSTNNVANGYPNGTFKPKQLITRGHFAAFLTRAMTVRQINILPDAQYTYYYTNGNNTYRHVYDGVDEYGNKYWKVTNETKYEKLPRLVYKQDKSRYGAGDEEGMHFDTYLAHPFAVHTYIDDGHGPVDTGDVYIISTNAVKSVHGTKYLDVLVVETYFWWNKKTIIEYYAKDIGLIQRTDGKGNELYGLVKRVKNK